jgi:tagatose-1,6-bisphosphate aldolase
VNLVDVSVDGRFGVLAIDHRDSLRQFLAPDDPDSTTAAAITELKRDIVSGVGEYVTGVMLEPEFSIPHLLDGTLPAGVGFIAALEAQGYLADPEARPTAVLDGWSVEAAKHSGASAAKLLLPYRPDRPHATDQDRVAREVVAECLRVGIPLVLEPLFYGLDDPSERRRIVIETVERLVGLGPDLLKLPFPAGSDDRSVWATACRDVSDRCEVPWTLLSGGGSYEAFRDQLQVAMGAGCSGFMVGRALWGEAARASTVDRVSMISDVVAPRLIELRAIIEM